MLWGFSKVDLRHSHLLKLPSSPFLVMVKALLQRSADLLATDAAPVNYSMIMWSLGNVSFHPGDAYMQTFMHNLHHSGLLPYFDAQARTPRLLWLDLYCLAHWHAPIFSPCCQRSLPLLPSVLTVL